MYILRRGRHSQSGTFYTLEAMFAASITAKMGRFFVKNALYNSQGVRAKKKQNELLHVTTSHRRSRVLCVEYVNIKWPD